MSKKKIIFVVVILLIVVLSVLMFTLKGKVKSFVNDGKTIINNPENIKESLDIKKEEVTPENVTASVPIFMYHFILDDYGNNSDIENFLKPETLDEQLKYITENGYQTIFINEIEKLYNYTKPVALTFDDCFVYFYNNAFPLFKKYNQKATLNIIENYINGENYLTDSQIREMIDSGLISIESHTLTHSDLTTLSNEKQREEILKSKENLENRYNIQLNTICYPYGRYNNTSVNIAKEKYKYGLNMTGGMYYSNVHSLYNIPRIYANRSMSLNTFASYLKKSSVDVKW